MVDKTGQRTWAATVAYDCGVKGPVQGRLVVAPSGAHGISPSFRLPLSPRSPPASLIYSLSLYMQQHTSPPSACNLSPSSTLLLSATLFSSAIYIATIYSPAYMASSFSLRSNSLANEQTGRDVSLATHPLAIRDLRRRCDACVCCLRA